MSETLEKSSAVGGIKKICTITPEAMSLTKYKIGTVRPCLSPEALSEGHLYQFAPRECLMPKIIVGFFGFLPADLCCLFWVANVAKAKAALLGCKLEAYESFYLTPNQ